MDTLPGAHTDASIEAEVGLPYDDAVSYSEPPPSTTGGDAAQSSLADRIGHTKVYLISDALAKTGKRKYEEDEEEDDMEEDVSDPSLRDNAILLHGSPIANLPTDNIFAYATHFEAHPIGLEWIDDTTCILVFPSKGAARGAFRVLTKSYAEEPSEEGFITSKPVPVALWPPEERINKSLGMGEGLKGTIRMRWALTSDVKKKGANKESQFYKKYGRGAGKGEEESWPAKKRRVEDGGAGGEQEKARLDDELDAFLAEGEEDARPQSPPSKMRADYINRARQPNPRSLLERTGVSLESRLTAPLPRRPRRGDPADSLSNRLAGAPTRGRDRRTEGGRAPRNERPKMTQEDLDAELDAFIHSNA